MSVERKLAEVAREIDQVAVAVSVVGTSRAKLRELGGMAIEAGKDLVGTRPEVRAMQTRVARVAHNAIGSHTGAKLASRRLRVLADMLRAVLSDVESGVGAADPYLKIGAFDAWNTWGYTDAELQPLEHLIESASRLLRGVGLESILGGDLELDPSLTRDSFVRYLSGSDALAFDLAREVSDPLGSILRAFAVRLWRVQFGNAEREAWGGDPSRFFGSFADTMNGDTLDSETAARLAVSVRRVASRWPEAA